MTKSMKNAVVDYGFSCKWLTSTVVRNKQTKDNVPSSLKNNAGKIRRRNSRRRNA